MNKKLSTLVSLLAIGASTLCSAQSHPKIFAALKTGGAVVENNKVIENIETEGLCRDGWFFKDGSRLIARIHSVIKYDPAGKVIFTFKGKNHAEIHNCMPLPNGHTMLTETETPSLIELDATGNIVKQFTIPGIESDNVHMRIRGARKRANGEYVLVASADNKVIIINNDGTLKNTVDLKKLPAPLASKKPHGVALLANGNMMIGTGAGKCVVELDSTGKVVWSLIPKELPELGIKYIAAAHIQPNGNIVVAAAKSKHQLFAVTRDKKVVWKFAGPKVFSASHLQVLTDTSDIENFKMIR